VCGCVEGIGNTKVLGVERKGQVYRIRKLSLLLEFFYSRRIGRYGFLKAQVRDLFFFFCLFRHSPNIPYTHIFSLRDSADT